MSVAMDASHSFEVEEVPPARAPEVVQAARSGRSGGAARGSFAMVAKSSMKRVSSGAALAFTARKTEQESLNGATFMSEGLSKWEAVMSISICACGAGVTVFPKVMSEAGFVFAPVLMIVCCFCCVECSSILCLACDMAERTEDVVITSYEELARHAGGPTLEKVLMCTKNTAFLCFVVVYAQFQTETIGTFMGECPNLDAIRFFIVLPLFIVLAMVRDLTQLAKFNILGVLAGFIQCGGIILGGLLERMNADPCGKGHFAGDSECRWYSWQPRQSALALKINVTNEPPWMSVFGKALATCVFGFAVLATVPSYRHQLANRHEAKTVWRSALFLILGVYLAVMGVGYIGYGAKSEDNIIVGISADYPLIGGAAALAIIVNLTVSTPIFLYCFFSVFQTTGDDNLHTAFTPENIVFRIMVVIALVAVSWGLPFALEVIGLVSAVFGVCNNLFFPNVMYYMTKKQDASSPPQVPHWRWMIHVGISFIGVACLIFGFKGALATLLEKLEKGAEATPAACT